MELGERERIHATRVLRLELGDTLHVFDEGREFRATISRVERHRVEIEVGAPITPLPERAAPIHLIMSPLKGDLTELVIQKATELGVARLSPATFERTDPVARREPGAARLERWQRVAVGAAEQSGRAVVPPIEPLRPLAETVADLGSVTEGELRLAAIEPSIEWRPAATPPGAVRRIVVAVGPAGGLSDRDRARLEGAGFGPLRLAAHTLRSETACIAAVAILGDRYRS